MCSSDLENVQADMIKLKPEVSDDGPTAEEAFAALLDINSDVCGWVTMDNTQIDLPILYGKDNLEYINKDVYGNFALAGSIFLDSRNDRNFRDPYSLLYGHHMADHQMFGDLDLYKDETFFRTNRTGTLILPDRTYDLEVISCLLVSASNEYIFEPTDTLDNIQGLLNYAEKKSLFVNEDVLERARNTKNVKILALSTCSSEFTDARTIVLTVMDLHTAG